VLLKKRRGANGRKNFAGELPAAVQHKSSSAAKAPEAVALLGVLLIALVSHLLVTRRSS
jgi:hypothetical protein